MRKRSSCHQVYDVSELCQASDYLLIKYMKCKKQKHADTCTKKDQVCPLVAKPRMTPRLGGLTSCSPSPAYDCNFAGKSSN